MAIAYDVRHPASTEMIENDTAKLLKLDSLRCNSCRYPSWRSRSSSLSVWVR